MPGVIKKPVRLSSINSGIPPTAPTITGRPVAMASNDTTVNPAHNGILFSQKLAALGVPTELHVYPGAYHGFDVAFDAGVTKRFRRDAVEALKRALTG